MFGNKYYGLSQKQTKAALKDSVLLKGPSKPCHVSWHKQYLGHETLK